MMLGPGLTARQKAAIIVRLLIADGEQLSLERLSPAAQAALAHEMALMGMIDRFTRDQVVGEFCETLEQVGLTFPEGLDSALDILTGTLSPDTTDRLRRIAAMAGQSDPWERISALSPRQLCDLALAEAVEIAAVMFSRLPVSKAAEAFSLMPATAARQIAYAMSLTGGIEAPALRRIGLALLQAADGLARPAMDSGPIERVGAILNFAPSGKRDEVLTGLDEDDADFAREVRKSIFAWPNIPNRIDPRDVPRILRVMDGPTLAKAIAGARDANRPAADFILSSLSSRMADSLREEVEAIARITTEDAEAAMTEVVATRRRMEAEGDLFLIAGDFGDDTADEVHIQTADAG